MKKYLPILFAVPLLLSACGGSEDPTPATSSAVTSSASSSSSTTSSASSSSSASSTISEPAQVQEPVVEPAPIEQSPVADNPSTGSIWAPAGTGYQCPRTDAFVYDPANCTSANLGGDPIYDSMFPGGQDLSNIPYADGGTCPIAKCGYGKDVDAEAVNAEKQAAHSWWADCNLANTLEYCRANDPWQQ